MTAVRISYKDHAVNARSSQGLRTAPVRCHYLSTGYDLTIFNQRTIGPENAHLKPVLGVLSHHEMTLTLNTHTPLLTSQVVCICKVSGLRLQ